MTADEPEGGTEPAAAGADEPDRDERITAGAKPRRFGPPRAEFWTFVDFFAVFGLLLVQPLLAFLGKNQRALTVLRLSLSDAVIFTLLVLVVPPLALWGFEVLVGLVLPAIRRRLHFILLGVLIGLTAAAILKVGTHVGPAAYVVTFVVVACLAPWALLRWSGMRQWVHVVAFAPLVFAILFVASSPTSVLYLQSPDVADAKVERPARVVMIVFDELPTSSLLDQRGHVDRELYPNFARLADDSTWYRNETTVAQYTGRAVPAIVTGRVPPTNKKPAIAQSYPQSLFTLLGGTYEMHAREKYEQLCPLSLCSEPKHGNGVGYLVRAGRKVLHNLVDLDRSSWDKKEGFRWGADFNTILGEPSNAAIANDFVDRLQPSDRPRLDYIHLELPHGPWTYLEGMRTFGADGALLEKVQNSGDRWVYSLGRQLHLLQLQATDWFLGQVMDRLEAMDEYDETLFVVTADHGVAFPYWRALTPGNSPYLMWTPLFVKAPGQSDGNIDDRPVLSSDVLPTMADILGVKIPWKVDGISALQSPRPEGGRVIVTRPQENEGEVKHFDGASGFQRMLATPEVPEGGDPDFRLYRIGPFGALTGRSTESLVQPAPKWLTGKRASRGQWENVDPDARSMPWALARGTVNSVPPGSSIAVAVNGRIAGLARVDQEHEYNAPLVPKLFVEGDNTVTPYLVRGTAKKPELLPIRELGTDRNA